MSYGLSLLMIASSTALMLLMYFNNYAIGHLFRSETFFYIALCMGAIMAVVILSFMRKSYTTKAAKGGPAATPAIDGR